jgi:lipopolysaccharide export system protein LptA
MAKKTIKLLLLLLVTHNGFTLPEDRHQIMQVQANLADLDQKEHRGTYLGNVALDQGSTHVRAAEAMTESSDNNRLIKAMIKGNKEAQAHYWTMTAIEKPPLHAYADLMYYYPERHTIELIGHARVEQGKDFFSAPNMTYDTLHQRIVSRHDGTMRTTIMMHQSKHP